MIRSYDAAVLGTFAERLFAQADRVVAICPLTTSAWSGLVTIAGEIATKFLGDYRSFDQQRLSEHRS